MRFPFAAACSILALAFPASAKTAGSEDDGNFDLGRIVVRGRTEQPAGLDQSSIGQAAIERFNRNSLDDAAALIPGVSVSGTGGSAGGSRNERLLYVRGFDRFQVPVSIDGIRVYLPADNRLDYGRFLTADLAEIQVAKGYASVLDGPGAMGGAINLVTRKPRKKLEAAARGVLDMDRDGDYAGYTGFGLIGTRQEKWYAQASFTRSFRDHWDLPGGFEPTESEDGGGRDFSRTGDWRVNAKLGFTPNISDEYSLSYTRQEGSKNAPLSTVDPVAQQRNWTWPYWNIDSIYFLSRTAITADVTLKTRLYRNTFDNLLSAYDDRTQTSQTRGRAFNSYYDDEAWGGSAELSVAVGKADTLGLALHYRKDEHVEYQQGFPGGDIEPPQHNEEDSWSAALQYIAALSPSLTATVGTSYDWRDLKRAEEFGELADGGEDVLFSYPVRDADAANVQARLDWRLGNATTAHASISSRARFPTIFERFSSRFGGATSNPGLTAERATQFEIGGSEQAGPLRLSGAVFYARVTDAIVSIPFLFEGEGVDQSRNVGDGDYYGVELSFDARLGAALTAGGNYTFTERELDNPADPDFQLPGVPNHKAFLYAEWQPLNALRVIPGLSIESDRWTDTTDGSRYFRTGSHVDASLRLDYDILDNVTLGAGIRNAFDDYYVLAAGFPEQGRRFFLSLRLTS